jgi:8-oxo-dGTP diphosphatase
MPGRNFPGVGTGLAILRDGKLLLYRRTRPPEAGHWSIVGGKVDMMEPTADAARREAEEETGLSIGKVELLGHAELITEADSQHWISILYRCTDFTGEPQVTEPDKMPEFGWFDLYHLPEPRSKFVDAAVRYLRST